MNKVLSFTLTSANLILYLVAIALWLSIPDERWLCLSLTFFNLSFSALLIFLNWSYCKTIFLSSWFQNLGQNLVGIFLIFCILGLVNYLGYKSPQVWDLTFAKLNSLTDQSRNIVQSLDSPVHFTIFANRQQAGAIRGLIELYRYENSQITMTTIDPEVRPDLVARYEVDRPNIIVVEKGERRERIDTLNELSITNALIRLTREIDPLICFSSGHGEANLAAEGQEGFSHLLGLLHKTSYRTEEIITTALEAIPDRCHALVILGPRQSFRDAEIEIFDAFFLKGKGVLVAIGPDLNRDLFANLRQWTESKGIKMHNDLVIDRLNHVSGSNGTIPFVNFFPPHHPIIENFVGPVFFPLASSLEIVSTEAYHPTGILHSSPLPASWGERNIQSILDGNMAYDEEEDLAGPITLMAASEGLENDGRMIVLGNANLVLNSYANYGSNFLLMMNAFSWLSGEERLIAFNSSAIKDEPVFINSHQLGLIFYFSVVLVPLILFFTAFYIYRRRSQL